MRPFASWLLFIMPFLVLIFTTESDVTNDDAVITISHEESMTSAFSNRKLKERSFEAHESIGNDLGRVNEDDYPHIDPSPSSKAAVQFGPIEHGAPLMPYIPRATPPIHPKHGPP